MRILSWFAAAVALTAVSTPSLALDEAKAKIVVASVVDTYIRPGYVDFHQKATALATETGKFCAKPSDDGLKAIQAHFADTIASWGRIEIIRTGPVLEENRFERILFYPDRKSTGLKQVQALLAKPDETAADPEALAGRSVAMQGLGAYEYVFYGAYPEGLVASPQSFRCRYGLAIARNVETIAAELQAAWDAPDGISKDWKNPSAENPVFRSQQEAVASLIGVSIHGIEMVRDQRIEHFYKGPKGKVSAKLALFWRSAHTMTALAANVEGLQLFWKAAYMRRLLAEDAGSLADAVDFDLKTAKAALAKLDQPSGDRLADPKYRAKLDFIELNLKDAMTRIDKDIAGAIGLGAGFSFSDGD